MNNTYPPFTGSKLKIERAKAHISELDREIQAFRARDPYRFFLEKHPNRRKEVKPCYVFRTRECIPIGWGTIIGDSIHNLRAALDLMVCDIIMLCGKSPKNVYFPFAKTPDGFETELKKKMKGAPPRYP